MPTFISPTEIIESGIVNAEKKLYLALKDQLGDDYTVFHSLEWVSTVGDFQPLGEIDFLIFHPEKGILSTWATSLFRHRGTSITPAR